MVVTQVDLLIIRLYKIFKKPASKGMLLVLMVIIAMIWANSPFYESYEHFIHMEFILGFDNHNISHSLHAWINDGLMAVFFFTVGLEIKSEIIQGELSTIKKATLPVISAFGGMIVPALLFLAINYGTESQNAWGIPMATDIAFTLGIISLLGSKVSNKLKVFLTALATADDLGAILVIAFFLTPTLNNEFLIYSATFLALMALGNYLGIRNVWFYFTFGFLGLWMGLLFSGIHATLAGVLGAFTIPATRKVYYKEFERNVNNWLQTLRSTGLNGGRMLSHHQDRILHKMIRETKRTRTPLQIIETSLLPVVNFVILPLFALANAGVRIEGDFLEMALHPVSIGIILGLVGGKVIGITLFSYASVKLGMANLTEGASWKKITGLGFFAGIGFTMSLFIAELAIKDPIILANAKVGIIIASVLSSLIGILWFSRISNKTQQLSNRKLLARLRSIQVAKISKKQIS